ncbi:Ephrin type-B receptor 3 (Fragment) [Seminavis robusta]|uniref:Ephrin type-B receptor 3 n=1 Tax=Seminavis robusta TaxID=568900 RepID=A0A9N8E913_9STRA
MSAFAKPIAGNAMPTIEKPRITYSSVIHSLVGQITLRSPFLRDTGDEGDEEADIALLYRNEILTGSILGQGNFSNVFEVADLDLRGDEDESSDVSYPRNMMQSLQGNGKAEAKSHRGPYCDETKRNLQTANYRRTRARLRLRDEYKHEQLCVKSLKPELLENKSPKVFLEAAADLVIEAKYLSKLNHENILKVRGLAKGWQSAFANGEYDSFFLLVDRLEETLNQRIKRWRNREYPEENTIEGKLPLLQQLASALSYLADRNLVFRDCKPQNIGLGRLPDGSLSVKLFDFGFCRQLPALDQARDDVEETASSNAATTLKSGEQMFLMSGKGTRRYMAPEVLIHNRYNLKADVYSWAMVAWETLTLRKPYYKYTKDQHMHHVCENGDRPPLEHVTGTQSFWPPPTVRSPSMSLSSMQSHSNFGSEASINFQQSMTDPIRQLLQCAWNQDVSERYSMKEVLNAFDDMDHAGNAVVGSSTQTTSSDVSTSTRSGLGYTCLSTSIANYHDVRDLVAEFANDLPELPFLACFGHDDNAQQENIEPAPKARGAEVEPSENLKAIGTKREDYSNVLQYSVSRIQTLIVQ